MLFQAYAGDDAVCLTITLPLAERMIKKFVEEKKIEAEAEVILYLMVLEKEVISFIFFKCFSFVPYC